MFPLIEKLYQVIYGYTQMLESKIQREILDYLELNRVLHWRIPVDGTRTASGVRRKSTLRGFPDILGILPGSNGKVFFIEVKTPKGKLSEDQTEFHSKLRNANCLCIVATSVQEVRYYIDFHLKHQEE